MTRTARDRTQRPSAIRTFLIADIRGYTRFTNELGDEAGSRLAAKFAQVTAEGIEAYGGTLLELRGDEALCVFDSARAALRCAVELQDAYADETRLEPHLPLTVGIGVDAGEAVPVGDGYRGAALNLAARLCSAAEAGQIIATDGLVHLAGHLDGLSYVKLDGPPLKGFDERVAASIVSSDGRHEHRDGIGTPAADPEALPAELDPIVPLVGRESDLRWLSWFWRRTRHGHGGPVVLSGPSGIGRTRLAAEIAARAHAQGAVVRYSGREESVDAPSGLGFLLLDDVDLLPESVATDMLDRLGVDDEHRLLVITHREPPPAPILRRLRRAVPPERRRILGPLEVGSVAEIARLYLERPGDDVPAQLIHDESEGLPAAIHRVASQWARAAAKRRLGESARRTSRERRELRAAEADLIGDVAALETVRERSRLYVDLAGPEPPAADAVPGIVVCPYKGLVAFEAVDAEYYFGRERLIAELIARMVGSAFVGLIGASGSGKSSALRAGLLPALAGGVIPGSEQWIQAPMRPGENPMRELQASLHRNLPQHPDRDADPGASLRTALEAMAPAQRILLVIDQFEELFAGSSNERERADFIALITEQMPGLKVIVALRADHYESSATYPRLARLLGADQVLVGPPTADEIEAIVKHPAERVGLRVEPELVEALVADVGVEPGGLPLLSTALLELWETRHAGRLTLGRYRATGGVRGAVARLAEAAYGELDEALQPVARAIFLRLASEGDGGVALRRRVRPTEIEADDNPAVAEVVTRLTKARLLTASDGYVEVAHEALLREWPRLRGWLEEDAAGRRLRLHLIDAARTWDEGGREAGDLYRGARLSSVLDWSSDHLGELNATERAFVDESRVASEREADRQRRANRNLRSLLAIAGTLLVLALGAGAYAAAQAERAEEESRLARSAEERAEEEARRALARELYASAETTVASDPELSILLALEARALGEGPDTSSMTALHRAIGASRSILHLEPPAPERRPLHPGVALSPDGTTLYTTTDMASVEVWDVASGRLLRTLGSPRSNEHALIPSIALSRNGERVAVVDELATVHLWDAVTGAERLLKAPGHGNDWPVFSPDGQRLATMTFAGNVLQAPKVVSLFDLDSTSAEPIRTWDTPSVYTVAFAADGDALYATDCPCDPTRAVILLDPDAEEPTLLLGDVEGIVSTAPTSAAFSPDGRILATAGQDGKVNVWSVDTGAKLDTYAGHTNGVTYLTFSPDGSRLASTSDDGTTRIWDVSSGEPLMTLAGQGGSIGFASFSADGSRIATASSTLAIRVWDLTAAKGGEVAAHDFGAPFQQIKDIAVAGHRVAALLRPCNGYCEGRVSVVDLHSDQRITFSGLEQGAGIGLSPDGQRLVSQGYEESDTGPTEEPVGRIRMYDVDSAAVVHIAEPICVGVSGEATCEDPLLQLGAVAFAPDGGSYAVTAYNVDPDSPDTDCWVALYDSADGRIRRVLTRADTCFNALTFSPDGSRLAVATHDHVWILRVPSLIAEATIEHAAGVLAFAPDGLVLAVGSATADTTLYETATWSPVLELPVNSAQIDFSDDGARVLTADTEGALNVWDQADGSRLHHLPIGRTLRGVFLGDSQIVTRDGTTVVVLTIDPRELLEIAEQRVTRSLTEQECARYLHTPCTESPRNRSTDS